MDAKQVAICLSTATLPLIPVVLWILGTCATEEKLAI